MHPAWQEVNPSEAATCTRSHAWPPTSPHLLPAPSTARALSERRECSSSSRETSASRRATPTSGYLGRWAFGLSLSGQGRKGNTVVSKNCKCRPSITKFGKHSEESAPGSQLAQDLAREVARGSAFLQIGDYLEGEGFKQDCVRYGQDISWDSSISPRNMAIASHSAVPWLCLQCYGAQSLLLVPPA